MLAGSKMIFENLVVKNLISRVNVCAPDWGETDCIYGYNKFYYFLAGEGTLVIEGDKYQPEPEELFLIPAGTRHTYFHDSNNPVYKFWCHFDLSLGEGKKLVYSKYGTNCKVSRKVIEPVFKKLVESCLSKKPLDALSEKAALLELLRIFMDNIDFCNILPEEGGDFMAGINDYIERNMSSCITLRQLAGLVHLHPNYFTQYFKKHFNVSPIEHVNILRLEKAARLLMQEQGKSIAEVAIEVGFNDYRYFGRMFRKRYGITPSAYKGIHLI